VTSDLQRKRTPKTVSVHLTGRGTASLRRGHPWVFEDAISREAPDGAPGDVAALYDPKRRFVGVGLYDPQSPIRVRVLERGSGVTVNRDLFRERLQAALEARAPLRACGATNGYRWCHGPNDRLPGLVVDRYRGCAVVKVYTCAWAPYLEELVEELVQVGHDGLDAITCVVLRLSRIVGRDDAWPSNLPDGRVVAGELVAPVTFQENGITFEIDPVRGQKTGFFLDQRENRARVERIASGATVLNVFAYSGGFSLYAGRGGARHVTSLDISTPALESAARNVALNRDDANIAACTFDWQVADAFEQLAAWAHQGRTFDVVIVDPPAFAKRRAEVARALNAYQRLARLAHVLVRPGGNLVFASCSSRVSPDELRACITTTLHHARRQATLIEETGHPIDHPVAFDEARYLKCMVFSLA